MEIITIQELAQVLADKKKLELSVARTFVATMFDVIRVAIERDRLVKVKGLGTFKLIEVGARESVSVNNGERVVIGSHGKISFTPDAVMKELVNKPFSQFETVVLNDGVEFDDMSQSADEPAIEPEVTGDDDDYYSGKPTDGQVSEATLGQEKDTADAVIKNEAEVDVAEEAGADVSEDDSKERADGGDAAEEVVADVSAVDSKGAADEEEGPDGGDADEATAVSVDENQPEQVGQTTEGLSAIPKGEADTDFSEDAPEGHRQAEDALDSNNGEESKSHMESRVDGESGTKYKVMRAVMYCLLVVLLMAMSAYGGYLYGLYEAYGPALAKDGESQEATEVVQKPQIAKPKVAADTVVAAQAQPKDTIAEMTDKAIGNAGQSASEVRAESKAKADAGDVKGQKADGESFDPSIYEAMDSRVRTGAYRIIGTDHVVRVKQGETLKKISDRALGPGMECYVEVYNSLESGTALKEGQQLKIPKLKLKKKRK